MAGARYEQIAAWVREQNWTLGAELGIFDGRTHLYLLERCSTLHLIGVDVWDLFPDFKEGPTKSGEKCRCEYCNETRAGRRAETVTEMRVRVRKEAEKYGTRSLIIPLRTTDAAAYVQDGTLDFCFVDGDHSFEGVRDDIAAWRPKLKPDGWLIGHDFNLKSVRDGVHAHFKENEVITTHTDHVWVVRGG